MGIESEAFAKFLDEKHRAKIYDGKDLRIISLRDIGRRYIRDLQKDKNLKPGSPAPYLEIADLSNLGACAFISDGIDCIALNRGVVEVIESLFNHILADPGAFKLSRAPDEVKPPLRCSLVSDTAYMDGEERLPINPERTKVAELLYRHGIDFLCAHEIAHIRHGHVKYLMGISSEICIEEDESSTSLTYKEIIIRQALEMNADAFAVAQGLDNLQHWVRKSGNPEQHIFLRETFSCWLYSVCTLFRLFAHNRLFCISDLDKKVHPPARVRLIWVIQTALARSKGKLFDLSVVEVYKIAKRIALYVEEDIATITGTPVDQQGMLTATDPEVDKHLDILRAKYAEIENDLKVLSYSNIIIKN